MKDHSNQNSDFDAVMETEIQKRLRSESWPGNITQNVISQYNREQKKKNTFYRFAIPVTGAAAVFLLLFNLGIGLGFNSDQKTVAVADNPFEKVINHQILGTYHQTNPEGVTENYNGTYSTVMHSDVDQWMDATLDVSYDSGSR